MLNFERKNRNGEVIITLGGCSLAFNIIFLSPILFIIFDLAFLFSCSCLPFVSDGVRQRSSYQQKVLVLLNGFKDGEIKTLRE